jgi:MYXO-CTERM domain-containing protein
LPRLASVAAVALLLGIAGAVLAQPAGKPSTQFELGRAAMAAHDPTAAIAHFEQVHTTEGFEWLSVALMMESRSPSDQFVERAFEAAQRARLNPPAQLQRRADITAALRPGDMVIAFLVGEAYAYAWAFDRDGFAGYQLPPPAEIATAVDRATGYADTSDRDGLKRIADDLMPSLLGPATDRIPQLTRVMFVADGPLRRLAIGELPAGDSDVPLRERLAVATAEYGSVIEAISRQQPEPAAGPGVPMSLLWPIGAIVVLMLGGAALWRRRSSVA